MPKSYSFNKLSKEKQKELLLELCRAIMVLNDEKEAAQLLSDLLTTEELRMVAKRLQIAKMLVEGENYREIMKDLKVSSGTIARVNVWLNQAGQGYRLVISRSKKLKNKSQEEKVPRPYESSYFDWPAIRKRYPIHFLLFNSLDELKRTAKGRQKEKLIEVYNTLEKTKFKDYLHKSLTKS